MYALFHFKKEPPSGFDYIKPINQFHSLTVQHSVLNTLDCFHYPCTHVFTVVYRISGNTILHTSPKDRILGELGARRLIGLSPDIYLKSTSALMWFETKEKWNTWMKMYTFLCKRQVLLQILPSLFQLSSPAALNIF